MATFQSRLQEAMKKKRISQAELARRTGLSRTSISKYLKGNFVAKQNALHLLAHALNISEAWLMGNDNLDNSINELVSKMVNETVDEFTTYNGHIVSDIQISDIKKILTAYLLTSLSAQHTSMQAIAKAYLDALDDTPHLEDDK